MFRFELFVVFTVISGFQCLPFLLGDGNAQSFLTSAVASASSSSSQTDSHIADLRGTSMNKNRIKENYKLNDEDDDFFKDRNEGGNMEEEMNKNEALPSFIHKKIGKILHKLQLISVFRKTVLNSNDGVENENKEDEERSGNEKENINQEDNQNEKEDKAENKTETNLILPERLQLLENSIEEEETEEKPPKINPSSIGVFFMELLGTIVGLAYGAAAHISNATNGSN